MNITLDHTLTLEEWAEAFRASNRSARHNRRPIVLLMITAAVLAAVLFLLTMTYAPRLLNSLLIVFAPALLVTVFGWFLLQRKLNQLARVEWESSPTLRSRCTITIDEVAITINQQYRQASWQWPAFTKFDETKSTLMLYVSGRSFLTIPKRTFADADLRVFVEFLRRTLPPANANSAGFEVVSKPAPARPVYVQPLESRDFM